jgi:hypothetical protein
MSAILNLLRQLDRTLSSGRRPSPQPRAEGQYPEGMMETTSWSIETAIKRLTTPLQMDSTSNDPHQVTGYLRKYMTENRIDDINTAHMTRAAVHAIVHIIQNGKKVDKTKCPPGSDYSFIEATTFMPLMYGEVSEMFQIITYAIDSDPRLSNNTGDDSRKMKEQRKEPPHLQKMKKQMDEPLNLNNIETYLQNKIETELLKSLTAFHLEEIHPSWLNK